MKPISVKLKCSNVQGLQDNYTIKDPDETLKDLSDWIWKKYSERIMEYNRREVGGLIERRDRIVISFFFINAMGEREPLDYTDVLKDLFVAYNIDIIYWQMPPVGGATPEQQFAHHAIDVVERPAYRHIKYITPEKPGSGIKVVTKDKDMITRTIKITPSKDYPKSPPVVICIPAYTNDPCWRSGKLAYTGHATKKGSPWLDLALGSGEMPASSNPLMAIIIELRVKYGFFL